jgi:hypothetical protein
VILTRLTATLFALVLAVGFSLASANQSSSTWKADSGERSGVLQSVTLRAAAMRLDVGVFSTSLRQGGSANRHHYCRGRRGSQRPSRISAILLIRARIGSRNEASKERSVVF